MSLDYWGTASSNHHISLGRQTNIATWTRGYPACDILVQSGTGSTYEIHHVLAGTLYERVNFLYIDTSISDQGTYNYCIYLRSNSGQPVASNIENGQHNVK